MEIDKAVRESDDQRLKTKYNNAIYVIRRALALYSWVYCYFFGFLLWIVKLIGFCYTGFLKGCKFRWMIVVLIMGFWDLCVNLTWKLKLSCLILGVFLGCLVLVRLQHCGPVEWSFGNYDVFFANFVKSWCDWKCTHLASVVWFMLLVESDIQLPHDTCMNASVIELKLNILLKWVRIISWPAICRYNLHQA